MFWSGIISHNAVKRVNNHAAKKDKDQEKHMLIFLNQQQVKTFSIVQIEKQTVADSEAEIIESYQAIPYAYPPNAPQLKKAIENNEKLSLVYKQTILRSHHFSPHVNSRLCFPLTVSISSDTCIRFKVIRGIKAASTEQFGSTETALWFVKEESNVIEYWQTQADMTPNAFLSAYTQENCHQRPAAKKDMTCKYKLFTDKNNYVIGAAWTPLRNFYFGKNCCLEAPEIETLLLKLEYL